VAADPVCYEALAIAKASDASALAALRSEMRARVKASPLCDARRIGRHLGAALRHAWADWCARPAPIGAPDGAAEIGLLETAP
jgi:predicted O-linked N-acetylglucosamine transferase (SPINDLY family)